MKNNWLVIVLAVLGTMFIARSVRGGMPRITQFRPPTTIKFNSTYIAPQAPLLPPPVLRASVEPEVITLSKENTLSFNGVVTEMSAAQFEHDLMEMSNQLPRDATITVVMYTPGGDVASGSAMIDSAKAIPQKIKTLTLFSASMGFHLVQALGERMITPSGVLMSHRARGGIEGEFDGSISNRYKMAMYAINRLTTTSANRMGLQVDEYKNLIRDEYWVEGLAAIDDNAADRVVLAKCDDSLSGEHISALQTMFGPINLTMSNCPLITSPLGVAEGSAEATKFVSGLYQDPTHFVDEYIVTDKFRQVLK